MKTPEEIKKGLSVCSKTETLADDEDCKGCPYYIEGQILCGINTMLGDSLSYIDQLEERIALMMIQMRGDCGVCKHKYEEGEPCCSCITNDKRPGWEYEGLPEIGK